jgi:hypothetical protein
MGGVCSCVAIAFVALDELPSIDVLEHIYDFHFEAELVLFRQQPHDSVDLVLKFFHSMVPIPLFTLRKVLTNYLTHSTVNYLPPVNYCLYLLLVVLQQFKPQLRDEDLTGGIIELEKSTEDMPTELAHIKLIGSFDCWLNWHLQVSEHLPHRDILVHDHN